MMIDGSCPGRGDSSASSANPGGLMLDGYCPGGDSSGSSANPVGLILDGYCPGESGAPCGLTLDGYVPGGDWCCDRDRTNLGDGKQFSP